MYKYWHSIDNICHSTQAMNHLSAPIAGKYKNFRMLVPWHRSCLPSPSEEKTEEPMMDNDGEGGSRMSVSDMQAMGLCATCNSVATCTGRRTWCGPVLHCEEFDDRVEVAEVRPVAEASSAAPVPVSAEEIQRLGLCVNCVHRDGCGLSTQEGGVWHCEEYE